MGDPRIIDRLSPVARDISRPFSMDEVSAAYVEDIQRLVPKGAFVLLGFCGGGVVAYEGARRLSALGRVPQMLVMVSDWHAPGYDRTQSPWIATKLNMHLSLLRRDPKGYAGPCLILRGADDPQFPPDQDATSWANLLPKKHITRVPGFFPPLSQPPFVSHLAEAIRDGLARGDGTAPRREAHKDEGA